MSIIYTPKGRAREYAALACNIYRGCDHGCTYCYAPSATYQSPDDFRQSTERKQFLTRLRSDATTLHAQGTTGQVLLSFTCDPYQWLDVYSQHTRGTIQVLHENGFSVCVLTKGAFRALRDLDLFGPSDAFATTMTLLNPKASHEWEPRAAEPQARMHVIRRFHAAGIPTGYTNAAANGIHRMKRVHDKRGNPPKSAPSFVCHTKPSIARGVPALSVVGGRGTGTPSPH